MVWMGRSARSARARGFLWAVFHGAAWAAALALVGPAQAQGSAAANTPALAAGSAAPTPVVAPAASRYIAPGFAGLSAADAVVLMPVDVELFSISGGGVLEPKADWTASALGHMNTAITERKSRLGLKTLGMSSLEADEFAEQIGLHAAVARSVALHHFGPGNLSLPSKAGQLDWSFADAMQPLRSKTGARYGLFVWVRDSYASAERKAAMVAFALLGVGLVGGSQVGYASLVDLETGRLVWFNQLARASGDLREADAARSTVEVLFTGFPAPQ
jgi:hypothetical protein